MTDNAKLVMVGAGVALVALVAVWFVGKKGAQAAAAVGEAVNPLNNENIFHQGASATVGAIVAPGTPAEEFSLGGWLWEKMNPGAVAREREALGLPAVN